MAIFPLQVFRIGSPDFRDKRAHDSILRNGVEPFLIYYSGKLPFTLGAKDEFIFIFSPASPRLVRLIILW